MAYLNFTYSDELYHHGILGQKWGVRRYQNPDGTYTAKGKIRRKQVEADIAKLASIYKNNKELNRLADEEDAANNKAYDAFVEYGKKLGRNKKLIDDTVDKILKDYSQYDDDSPELLDLAITDHVDQAVSENRPKELSDYVEKQNKARDRYFSECEKLTAPILDKYGNIKLNSSDFARASLFKDAKEYVAHEARKQSIKYQRAVFDKYMENYGMQAASNDIADSVNLKVRLTLAGYDADAQLKQFANTGDPSYITQKFGCRATAVRVYENNRDSLDVFKETRNR